MVAIRIEPLSDTYDCETCGTSWASGANVYFDGDLILELEPHANCYDGTDYSDEAVYRAIIEKLGHTVEASE